MKSKGLILVVALTAIAAILVSGGTVMAGGSWHGGGHHGGGGHWGWHGGWGWGWPVLGLGVATGALLSYPYYYRPNYPYYPYAYAPAYSPSTTVIVRERAPAYADERAYSEPARTRSSARDTWYYCKNSNAYYPYVRKCAGGWEKVPAVPPPSGPDDYR